MMLRSLLVLSSLLLAMPAQRGAAPVPAKPGQENPEGGDAVSADGSLRAIDGKEARLTPEQAANAGMRRGASSFCQFRVDTRPAKLMPGQTGTAIVTALMKGQAVMQAPTPVEVVSIGQQGQLTLGAPSFLPARLGRHGKAYVGRPVYDNWATIELPVTVSVDAVVGQKLNLGIEMKFELYDGDSAQSIGQFMDRAVGMVEIGQSLDPAVRGGYTPPANVVAQKDDAARQEPTPSGPDGNGGVEALGAAPTGVAPTGPAAPTSGATDATPMATPKVGDDSSSMLILLAGGGALLAAVLLLVLKRK